MNNFFTLAFICMRRHDVNGVLGGILNTLGRIPNEYGKKKNAKRVLLETEMEERDTRNRNPTRLFFVMVELNFKVWAYTKS